MWVVAYCFILYSKSDAWGLNESTIGLYESIMFVAVLAGSYFWSYIADKYGRSVSFKRQIFVLMIGAVGMTCSNSLLLVVLSGVVQGFAIGGELSLSLTVYKELIPASCSSTICILMLGFNVGNLIAALLAMIVCSCTLPYLEGWRWMCIILCLIEVGFLILRLKIPETPFFYASQGRMEEAQEVLNNVR
mmetsp:Transcript_26157/g.46545  ORF Transcript_26157/g.46545 Transcript_26157/m.46545 type:complete len:190 (+) Transcript_26157:114-683(+)